MIQGGGSSQAPQQISLVTAEKLYSGPEDCDYFVWASVQHETDPTFGHIFLGPGQFRTQGSSWLSWVSAAQVLSRCSNLRCDPKSTVGFFLNVHLSGSSISVNGQGIPPRIQPESLGAFPGLLLSYPISKPWANPIILPPKHNQNTIISPHFQWQPPSFVWSSNPRPYWACTFPVTCSCPVTSCTLPLLCWSPPASPAPLQAWNTALPPAIYNVCSFLSSTQLSNAP